MVLYFCGPMKSPFLALLLSLSCLFPVAAQQYDQEELEYLRAIGERTASQTWWFFEHRLRQPLPEYRFHHVYLPFQDVWVKDVSPIGKGRFVGVIDMELPHGAGVELLNDSIRFHPRDIGDWIIVEEYYLLGGFTLWYKGFEQLKPYRKLGQFRLNAFCINDDFVKLSHLENSQEKLEEVALLTNLYFQGGYAAFVDSLKQRIVYPDYAVLLGIEGDVNMQFKLTGSGEIKDIIAVRGIGCGLHEEFRDAIQELQPYFTAPEDGRDVVITLPFHFRIRRQ